MYEKILVPLDGSKLAESVLPYVEQIAQRCDTKEVVLVSVTERIKGATAVPIYSSVEYPGPQRVDGLPAWTAKPEAPGGSMGETAREVPVGVGRKQRQAERYLNRIAKRLQSKGASKVSIEVLLGDPAEEIIIYSDLRKIDLIAMSSHGRSGISRRAHGSVADRVFRSVNVPVLMVRAPGSKAAGA